MIDYYLLTRFLLHNLLRKRKKDSLNKYYEVLYLI